ncbi:MAG: endonuclease/exonuclease/phosphatase family protein [Myxococcota bacterium]
MSIRGTITGSGIAVLAGFGLACNLEAALGVDGDGGSSGSDPAMTTNVIPSFGTGDTTGGDSAAESADSSDSGVQPSACGGRTVRVATFNIESVGAEASDSFGAAVDILQRIDADIVCLQEVVEWETTSLFALGNAAGYPDVIQGNRPPAIGGEFTNACMSRPGLRIVGSYGGAELSPGGQSNDVGRDILVVQADLAEAGEPPCRLGLVTLHLKSGQEPLDWFRRQVEAHRVAQAVALYQAEYPGDPMVILGDLNESIDDPALGSVFESIPPGLPDSYEVGSDIEFPLLYQPFETFADLGFSRVDATQEDSARDETWADLVRLDYVLLAGPQLQVAEVYNACRDNGVDDAPRGGWMSKAGDPLQCEVSEVASDHFPVAADLVLP